MKSAKIVANVLFVIAAMGLFLACSKSKPEGQAPSEAPAAQAQASHPQQATVSTLPTKQGSLSSFLVDIPGWTGEKAEDIKVNITGLNISNATRLYKKGNEEIAAMLIVGDPNQVLAVDVEEGQSESPEAKIEIKTVDGYKVQMAYMKTESTGSLAVLIKNDPVKGIMLAFSFDKTSLEEALNFAKKFDWNTIKQKAGEM